MFVSSRIFYNKEKHANAKIQTPAVKNIGFNFSSQNRVNLNKLHI